jgi:septum formation protein
MPERLILASASAARAALLQTAGIELAVEPAGIDEARVKRLARAVGDSAASCALALAIEKARAVAERDMQALVIGADQILVVGNRWLDKPRNLDEARAQLESLRGRTHLLATAACVVQGDGVVWQELSMPELTMRPFSEEFLDAYIAAEGDSLLDTVGAYRLEGRGVQLFSRIAGDHFAVLGLPLLELLGFLRQRGAIPA